MIKTHYTSNDRIYNRFMKEYDKFQLRSVSNLQDDAAWSAPIQFARNIEALAKESFRNGETEEAWLYLNRATQLGMGIFQSNAHDGVAFPFEFDNEYLEVVGKKTPHDTDESDWLKALFFATIRRNKEAIDFLMTVKDEVFAASSLGAQNTPFNYALVDLFRAVFTGGDLASALTNAVTRFDPDIYDKEAYLYVSRLRWPFVAIMRTIFTANAEVEFNQEMEKALVLHKEYYTAENDVDYFGVIPLGLTALAALAYDHKGYKVTVENEYIPKWMVEIDD